MKAVQLSVPARRFVDLMCELGWNQSQLAGHLQVSSNHVNQVVNGKREPSPALLAFLELIVVNARREDSRIAALIQTIQSIDDEKKREAVIEIAAVALKKAIETMDAISKEKPHLQ